MIASLSVGPEDYLHKAIAAAAQGGLWTETMHQRWREEMARGAVSVAEALGISSFLPTLQLALDMSVAMAGYGLHKQTAGRLKEAAALLADSSIFDWSKIGADALMEPLTWGAVSDGGVYTVATLRKIRAHPFNRIDAYRAMLQAFHDKGLSPSSFVRFQLENSGAFKKAYVMAQCVERMADYHNFKWGKDFYQSTDAEILTPILIHRAVFWTGSVSPSQISARDGLLALQEKMKLDPDFAFERFSDDFLMSILPECPNVELCREVIQRTTLNALDAEGVHDILIGVSIEISSYVGQGFSEPLGAEPIINNPIANASMEDALELAVLLVFIGKNPDEELPELLGSGDNRWFRMLELVENTPDAALDSAGVLKWFRDFGTNEPHLADVRDRWISQVLLPRLRQIAASIRSYGKIKVGMQRADAYDSIVFSMKGLLADAPEEGFPL